MLVLGASGYVGGRLVPELLRQGHAVRCMTRSPATLLSRPWHDRVDVFEGDLLDAGSLPDAFADVDVVYYLVHSLDTGAGFEERERRSAEHARRTADSAGVAQIVYLGGLGEEEDELSPHLRSRHEVGRVLADGAVPVTELRAAVILGSGSASFEMLRGLVEVLPVMVTPRWVSTTRCQPIGIDDVIARLTAVCRRPDLSGVWEIGGADVVTYRELMQAYAQAAGLRPRLIAPLPVLTPRLSARWVDFVTSLPGSIATELVEGLQNDVVVGERPLSDAVDLPRRSLDDALTDAIAAVDDLDIPTRWTPRGSEMARPQPWDPDWAGGTVMTDERSVTVGAPPDVVMDQVRRLGGDEGWFGFAPLWSARALIDELVGGPGWRRGRRHPTALAVGDVVDVFTVETSGARHLRLRADMRMPGWGWLEWSVEPTGDGGTRLAQCARFVPRGLWGRAYWIGLVPFHALIFGRMVRRIGARAEAAARDATNRHESPAAERSPGPQELSAPS